MAFSGRLGTDDSQLGDIELGSEGGVARTATDAPTTSDSATRVGGLSRSSTDAPSLSDSAVAVAEGAGHIQRTTTESVSISESASAARSYFRTVLDGPVGSDFCLDFTGGSPAGWTNDLFFEGGGGGGVVLFTRSDGNVDSLIRDGDPADDVGFTTMQLDFFTPDPIDSDYWYVEQHSAGMYYYVDNQYDFFQPPGAGNYGLYVGGAALLIDDTAIGSLVASNWYTIKAEADPDTRRTRAKIWETFGDPEPDWQLDQINPVPIGFWPLAIYAEVDDAFPNTITIDNACWTIEAQAGVTDSVARTLVATRQLTDETETDEWPVTNAIVETPVYGQVPNGYQPELAAPIDNTQTTITVTQPLPPGTELPILVYINGEYVLVTAVSPDGLTWTVVRGQNTSTATSHTTAHILPANTTISVGGVQVGADVSFSRTRLSTYANGQVGTGEIWIRGLPTGITTGEEVIVRHRNVRVWGGYIANIKRAYIFPAGTGSPGDEPSWVVLEVVDYNILFRKRIYYDRNTPTHMKVQTWPNGTHDDLVIGAVVNRHLNLGGDGLSFDIHYVGTPGLPVDSCNPDAPDRFQIAWAGYSWGDAMRAIADQTGGIYYIDPDKTFRYVDDSVKQSAFGFTGLSDDPGGTVIGYRDFELSRDATQLVNEQFTWGVGQGSTAPVLGHATAPTSIANHGLWQQAEIRFDMYCQGTVDLRANTWLNGSPQNRRGHKEDRIAIRATVFTPYLRVADVVSCESTTFDYIDSIPVRGAEITFPTPWDIQNVLTISHEYDSPWEAYEFAFPDFPDFRFRPPGPWGIPSFPPFSGCDDQSQIDILMKVKVEHELNAFSTNGIGSNRLTVRSGGALYFSPETGTNPFASGSPEDVARVFSLSVFRCDPQRASDGSIVPAVGVDVVNDPLDVYVVISRATVKRLDNQADNWIWIRAQLTQTDSGEGFVRAKVWSDTDPEPADWDDETPIEAGDTLDISAFKSIFTAPWVYGQAPDWSLNDILSYPSAPSGGSLIQRGYGRLIVDGIQINERVDDFDRVVVDSWGLSKLNGNRSEWVDVNTDADFGINASVDGDVGTLEVPINFYTHNVALSADSTSRVPYGYLLRLLADSTDGTFDWMGGCDPCLEIVGDEVCEVAPDSDFDDPVDNNPVYGVSPLGAVELENGNFLYTFDQQFLPGSTEVWADGLRLRLTEDYDEHPESAAIEIHSDAQSGFTVFDPGMVIIANMVPFVTHDPPPEYVP